MADVAVEERPVLERRRNLAAELAREGRAHRFGHLDQRRARPDRDIEDLVAARDLRGERGAQVGLHDVGHVAEVAGGAAVAVDPQGLAAQQRARPARHDRRVGALGVLARAEHVEVAQPGAFHAVGPRPGGREQLVDRLGGGVRRQRLTGHRLELRQRRMVAVHRAGGRVDQATQAGLARRGEQLGEAGRVRTEGAHRMLDGARHRSEGGLVQHMGHAAQRLRTGLRIADVAVDELEARPGRLADRRTDVLEVAPRAGREIVEADDLLAVPQQCLDQVRADEAGRTGDQPARRGQPAQQFGRRGAQVQSRHTE